MQASSSRGQVSTKEYGTMELTDSNIFNAFYRKKRNIKPINFIISILANGTSKKIPKCTGQPP
jgi:hypothetical protein